MVNFKCPKILSQHELGVLPDMVRNLLEQYFQRCQVCKISSSDDWVMPFWTWIIGLRKCPIRTFKGQLGLFLTQLNKFIFSKLIEVKTKLFQFALLKNRVRAFGERAQEKRKEEKQDLPRTIDFGCWFTK